MLLGGNELRIFRIERDETLIKRLIALESDFWRHVKTVTATPADASDSADRALRVLFPDDDREVIDFSEQPEVSGVFKQLLFVRSVQGRITWKKSSDSRRFVVHTQ